MNFLDTVQHQGHLEIVKIYENAEEVLFSDHNVIVSGMGQTIAQFMAESRCAPFDATCVVPSPTRAARSRLDEFSITPRAGEFPNILGTDGSLLNRCQMSPYNIKHFQLGIGASGVTEAVTVAQLGGPLTKAQYGNPDVASVVTQQLQPWSDEHSLATYEPQTFVNINTYGPNKTGITYVLVLDEDTCNGQLLNEIGLFSHNPFMKIKDGAPSDGQVGIGGAPNKTLLGGSGDGVKEFGGKTDSEGIQYEEDPGAVMCAYRQFRDIQKESFFTLLFRWTIYFSTNRAGESYR
tara:strand:- start:46 stop:921 length:876 start_codon:yes stop_codon:yes gene_type:complete